MMSARKPALLIIRCGFLTIAWGYAQKFTASAQLPSVKTRAGIPLSQRYLDIPGLLAASHQQAMYSWRGKSQKRRANTSLGCHQLLRSGEPPWHPLC